MNRGDTRTLIVIVCTAIMSSVGTAIVARLLIAPSDHHSRELEARVTTLEARPLPPPPPAPPPPPPPAAPVVEPSDPVPCDEVACVLDNYEPACCAKFHRPIDNSGDGLDRVMISTGVSRIKAKIAACGDRSSAKGKVKVSVKVAPDGTVSSVTLRETPDDALGTCVVDAMRRATFAATDTGGAFSYPFIF